MYVYVYIYISGNEIKRRFTKEGGHTRPTQFQEKAEQP